MINILSLYIILFYFMISTKINEITFDVLNSLPDMYLLLSDKATILNINKTACEILKIDYDSIIEKPFINILTPKSILSFEEIFYNFIKTKSNQKFRSQLLTSDKKIIDVEIYFSYMNNNSNSNPENIFLYVHNISEELKQETEFLRFFSVAEYTVNPLQITDLTGKMIYVNPAFEKASGFNREELIGKNASVFGSGKYSKKFWDNMWATISSGNVWMGEIENKKKNGEPFYTYALISPIIDKNNKVVGYFGIHRDLKEQKILEKQLIHTQKMESIGTLAAGIAHEVGNPLASISALVQIVQRATEDNFTIDKLELIKKQVNRISKIIRDLVDFSRPSNYELKITNINENIKEAVEIVKVGKKAKNIEFKTVLKENIPLLSLVADQIQQVFVNILINAVDAISERQQHSKLDFNGEIKIITDIDDENLIISFLDNGTGIPEEFQPKIFEPFFTTKKEGKGTGLGLWVSYGIIKSFQGEIIVKSKLEKGTSFIIKLPIQSKF
ncbi:MAG: hypothetical protein STSR0008_06750 [Ignavibacterium sp.]